MGKSSLLLRFADNSFSGESSWHKVCVCVRKTENESKVLYIYDLIHCSQAKRDKVRVYVCLKVLKKFKCYDSIYKTVLLHSSQAVT